MSIDALRITSVKENAAYRKACYDNPLFDEENGRFPQEDQTKIPHGDKNRQPRANDYHLPLDGLPPTEVRFRSSRLPKRKKIWIISGIVIAIILLAAVIGLVVHFVGRGPKQLPVLYQADHFQGSVLIVDGSFSKYKDDYSKIGSQLYTVFSDTFLFAIDTIFKNSQYNDVYSYTEILHVRPGSVLVEFTIYFHDIINIRENTEDSISQLIIDGFSQSVFRIDSSSSRIRATKILPTTTTQFMPSGRCVPIDFPTCVNTTSYSLTAFPNILGHTSQFEAMQTSLDHQILFHYDCYGYDQDFWCSVWVPECRHGRPLPPCRSYCQAVFTACSIYPPEVAQLLNCDTLPDSDDPDVCRRNPYEPGKCLKITDPECADIGYSYTSFPSFFGTISEQSSAKKIKLIGGIQLATHCYKHAILFACISMLPRCKENSTVPNHIVPPCRSICHGFQSRCEMFMEIFEIEWPPGLDCDSFPDEDNPEVCSGYSAGHEPQTIADCEPGELRCDNTTCIPQKWICDGYQDCADNLDEVHCATCSPDRYRCQPVSTLCIEKSAVCDGRNDCFEGVEESQCVRLGDGSNKGVLYIHNALSDEWEEVCGERWTVTFSHMVCEQLGYREATSSISERGTNINKASLVELRNGSDPSRIQSYLEFSSPCSSGMIIKLVCGDAVCGTRPARYASPMRLVGGLEVKPGTWPWLVSLHGGPGENFFCGGSLIHPKWVLTAGHCIGVKVTGKGLTVKIGHTRRLTFSRYLQFRGAKHLYVHENFDYNTVDNDIALIELDAPVYFNDYIRPACLPDETSIPPIGKRCMAAGWGKASDNANDYERAVKQVDLDIVTQESCLRALMGVKRKAPYQLTENMFCAGGTVGHDACYGDSGGPFMCRKNESIDLWYLDGIVSWGIGCAVPNVPGMYTRVPRYIDWIRNKTGNVVPWYHD